MISIGLLVPAGQTIRFEILCSEADAHVTVTSFRYNFHLEVIESAGSWYRMLRTNGCSIIVCFSDTYTKFQNNNNNSQLLSNEWTHASDNKTESKQCIRPILFDCWIYKIDYKKFRSIPKSNFYAQAMPKLNRPWSLHLITFFGVEQIEGLSLFIAPYKIFQSSLCCRITVREFTWWFDAFQTKQNEDVCFALWTTNRFV